MASLKRQTAIWGLNIDVYQVTVKTERAAGVTVWLCYYHVQAYIGSLAAD